MGARIRVFDAQNDVEGHSAGKEIEVEEITLMTSDGDEITATPGDDDLWVVTAGDADVVPHASKFRI